MNIIIDINIAQQVLLNPKDDNFSLLRKKLNENLCKIAYGGKLQRELFKNRDLKRRINNYGRAGRAYLFDSQEIDTLARKLKKQGICKSDDEHIIALAKISNARLLCTEDGELQDDFKDKDIINKPRGKIFKNRKHNRTLELYCSSCRTKTRK